MIITDDERTLARFGMKLAISFGMSGARVTLNKSVSDTCTMLDGEIDKVSRNADRALTFCLFAEGRYGTFSTNRLSKDAVRDFVGKACETVRIMEADPCRTLPAPERLARDAKTGLEAGLWDEMRIEVSPVAVGNGTPAAAIPADAKVAKTEQADGNDIIWAVKQ